MRKTKTKKPRSKFREEAASAIKSLIEQQDALEFQRRIIDQKELLLAKQYCALTGGGYE